MRTLSILWQVAVQLIVLLVVFAMFRAAKSPFESIVISGLTLIYVSVISSFSLLGRAMVENSLLRDSQFVEVVRLLNHPEQASLRDALADRDAALGKTASKFWVRVVATSIIAIVAIWNLLNAIAAA